MRKAEDTDRLITTDGLIPISLFWDKIRLVRWKIMVMMARISLVQPGAVLKKEKR